MSNIVPTDTYMFHGPLRACTCMTAHPDAPCDGCNDYNNYMMNDNVDFMEYIWCTLMPDVRGEFIHDDLKQMYYLLDRQDKDDNYVEWLSTTLIPDLRESGSDAMADDFARMVFAYNNGIDMYASVPHWRAEVGEDGL